MPLGLINAGASYQRIVNKLINKMLGRNVEAYMGDMLVNSDKGDLHKADLREAFECVTKHIVCLNPKKCSLLVK